MFVFENRPGSGSVAHRGKKAASVLCRALSFEFRAHDLRRTAATRVYDRYNYDAGFSADRAALLIDALRAVAQTGEVVESVESSHGEKFVVDGQVSSQTESSHSRTVRTVWIIDRGLEAPRLVTAYPGKE